MKWLIGLLDFRLCAVGWGADSPLAQQPSTSGHWRVDGEGGQTWVPGSGQTGGGATPAPAPAPAPADTGPDWAANRQTADIDRTSAYSHRSYRAALEGIDQTSRASGASMPAQAGDYEIPDTAFGQRLY